MGWRSAGGRGVVTRFSASVPCLGRMVDACVASGAFPRTPRQAHLCPRLCGGFDALPVLPLLGSAQSFSVGSYRGVAGLVSILCPLSGHMGVVLLENIPRTGCCGIG
jgi:hypothetical protein